MDRSRNYWKLGTTVYIALEGLKAGNKRGKVKVEHVQCTVDLHKGNVD